jgi:ribosomal protein L7Ae-like RNA K-turn-binding protein
MVLDAMKHRSLGIVFIASDISVDIGAKVKAQTLRVGVESISIFDKDRLGALIGKGLRSVVAVEGSGFIRSLRQEMEKYRNFFEGGRE